MHISYDLFNIKKGIYTYEIKEYQYWILLYGNGEVSSKQGTFFLSSHDIFEIPYNKRITLKCHDDISIGRIFLHEFKTHNTLFQLKSFKDNELIRRIFSFALELKGMHHTAVPKMMHHVDQLLYEALLMTGLENYEMNQIVAKATEEINQHIFDLEYDINSVVENSGYSQSYFRKIFREATGTSILGYIQNQRIDHAKYLLKQTEKLQLKEIAMRCGYTDVYYFSRIFKKYVGMAPGQFRVYDNAQNENK